MLNYTYLSTPMDLEDFNANDLARHRYVALFGLGRHFEAVPRHEFDLLCAGLGCFMRHECLVVLDSDLKKAPEKSFIKSIYHIFEPPPEVEAFVAVATVLPGVNDRLMLKPVYHELKWDADSTSRYPCLDALNHGLAHLEASLAYSSLEQVPLPELHHASRGLAIPNGSRIASLREKSRMAMEDVGSQRTKKGFPTIDRRTVSNAEKGVPVNKEVVEHLSEVFNQPYEQLVLDKVVPLQDRFREVRLKTGRTMEELAREFGLPSPFVFELLENATLIPADTMLFFHHHYKKLLGDKNLPFSSLVDPSRTGNRSS